MTMKILRPIDEDQMVIRFTKQQLRNALDNLERSGADEIGIPVKEDE